MPPPPRRETMIALRARHQAQRVAADLLLDAFAPRPLVCDDCGQSFARPARAGAGDGATDVAPADTVCPACVRRRALPSLPMPAVPSGWPRGFEVAPLRDGVPLATAVVPPPTAPDIAQRLTAAREAAAERDRATAIDEAEARMWFAVFAMLAALAGVTAGFLALMHWLWPR